MLEIDALTNDVLYLIYLSLGGFLRFFIAGIWTFSIVMFLVELTQILER